MFETAVLVNGPSTNRVWGALAGFTGQAMLIGCALLAPLVWPQVIPRVSWVMTLAPPGPPPPPPAPAAQPALRHVRVVPLQTSRGLLTAPVRIPEHPLILVDEPEVAGAGGGGAGVVGGTEQGMPGGIVNSIVSQAARYLPLVKPPEEIVRPAPSATAAPAEKPVRISVLQMGKPVYKVEPVYPQLARQARISGTVELLGVLGVDGRIHELRVVHGHPLLIDAAMSAVRQWVYAPTILNGQPVEVQAPIQVNFILSR